MMLALRPTVSRRRFRAIAIATVLAATVTVYVRYSNYLPPRTARKLASLHSGLEVPRGTVNVFEEMGGESNSDHLTEITMTFAAADFAKLARQARDAGFRPLEARDTNSETVRLLAPRSTRELYRIEGSADRGPFRVLMLDIDRRQLFVRALVRPK